ncbi:MAG: hypothetical protein KF889_12910 [Alphaproteobacteria bacterium]|nr:hypothetical protein [Alphaproteobacteria bacterium]MCW5739105.1 hypothetical protein [Alphaproteobacteria bacterium]
MSADRFYESIPKSYHGQDRGTVTYFVYYLTEEKGQKAATAKSLKQCFMDCHLPVPGRIAQYLSEGLTSNPVLFVKVPEGYRLERNRRRIIASSLGVRKEVVQTSSTLRALESDITDPQTKDFLKEAIDCYEAGANRAAVIMTWVLAFDHFLNWLFSNKLTEFNRQLAAKAGMSKAKTVAKIEDFEEINEDHIITTCRSATIITAGVQKTLKQSLDIRNSAAHPSDVKIGPAKTVATIEDLVENILKKY